MPAGLVRTARRGIVAWVLALAGSAIVAAPAAARNTVCTVQPRDPAGGSFSTLGFGTPQVRANRILVKATDNAAFAVACAAADSGPFTVTLEYGFQYEASPGTWVDLGPAFSCSGASVGSGGVGVVVLAGPPAGGCPEARVVLEEDDPTLGLPHRLRLALTTSDGTQLQGVSNAWTHEKVG